MSYKATPARKQRGLNQDGTGIIWWEWCAGRKLTHQLGLLSSLNL